MEPTKGTNMNYCGGFFRNWTFAAVRSLHTPRKTCEMSFVSDIINKRMMRTTEIS